MKIILGGVISVQPFSPGIVWDWMQLATGLKRLGHEVFYVEEVGASWCVDHLGQSCALGDSVNHEVFRAVMKRFGLAERAYQFDVDGNAAPGSSLERLLRDVGEADLLINMSGHLELEAVLAAAKRRVYVDQDPVYTQLWNAAYGQDLEFHHYDAFLTVGLNIGTAATPIPDCGLYWRPVLQPVIPDEWTVRPDAAPAHFTTIASWTGYASLSYRGVSYGSKYKEFMHYATLPERVDQSFEVAMRRYAEEEEGIQSLRRHGWRVLDSSGLFDLDSYQRYIAQSRAEIGIAKNAYVVSRSGWFSDRATHYLASGRPVLAQSTGFEGHLPTGRGLLAFASMEEAVHGVEEINRDYARHCRAARELAHEYLDYRKVIPAILEACYARRSLEATA